MTSDFRLMLRTETLKGKTAKSPKLPPGAEWDANYRDKTKTKNQMRTKLHGEVAANNCVICFKTQTLFTPCIFSANFLIQNVTPKCNIKQLATLCWDLSNIQILSRNYPFIFFFFWIPGFFTKDCKKAPNGRVTDFYFVMKLRMFSIRFPGCLFPFILYYLQVVIFYQGRL